MRWEKVRHNLNDDTYKFPDNWVKIHYFTAFNLLFRFENALRLLVFLKLKSVHGKNWVTLNVSSDDNKAVTIGKIGRQRLYQNKGYRYLGYEISNPLLHLTSGELIRLITTEKNWKNFNDVFLASKSIVQTKLDEITNIRNAVAHFRPVKFEDVLLIEQNIKHTCIQVEKYLSELIYCPDIVPSNTQFQPVKKLMSLDHKRVKLKFSQSEEFEITRFTLVVNQPIINEHHIVFENANCKAVDLNLHKFMKKYAWVSEFCLFATEKTMSSGIHEHEHEVESVKIFNFTLTNESLVKNIDSIVSQLEEFFIHFDDELKLITNDLNARGDLLDVFKSKVDITIVTSEHGDTNEPRFALNIPLHYNRNRIDSNSPVEYWVMINNYSDNLLTDSDYYPWSDTNVTRNMFDEL